MFPKYFSVLLNSWIICFATQDLAMPTTQLFCCLGNSKHSTICFHVLPYQPKSASWFFRILWTAVLYCSATLQRNGVLSLVTGAENTVGQRDNQPSYSSTWGIFFHVIVHIFSTLQAKGNMEPYSHASLAAIQLCVSRFCVLAVPH